MAKPGKERFSRSNDAFINDALTGGNEQDRYVDTKNIGDGQRLVTSFGSDNVKLAMPMPNSQREDHFGGGINNLAHSVTGASAKNDSVAAVNPKPEKREKDH
jgi:hypothetical protein